MSSASDFLSSVIVIVGVTSGYCLLSYLSDDFRYELQRMLETRYWTIPRNRGLLVRFCGRPTCKSALAGCRTGLRRQLALFHPRFVRYGAWARAFRGRVVVPQRVKSSTSELKPAQRRALLALESEPGASLTRSEYERLTGAGRSQAAYDLSELVSAGMFVRVGGGRSTRYMLAHEPASQRRWTPDRIRRELDMFCANRSAWPTAREFKTAGRGDLYVAASRYGGVAHWAKELGLDRLDRSRAEATAARVPLRSRLAWGLAGALASGALAAAGVTAMVATHQFGRGGKTAAKASVGAKPPRRIVHESSPRPDTASSAQPRAPRVRRHATGPSTRATNRPQSTPTRKTSLISEPLQPVSARAAPTTGAPTTSETLTGGAARSGGAAPLPAPSGASAPSPLRAP